MKKLGMQAAVGLAKGDVKGQIKSYAKTKAKKWLFKLLMTIMIPWGLIITIILLAICGVASYFMEPISSSHGVQKNISEYIESHVETVDSKDYLGLDTQCATTKQIIENYIKFLMIKKKISTKADESSIKKIADEAIKELTPTFTYKDGIITVTAVDKKTGKKTVTTQKVTLLDKSTSVYGDTVYKYKNEDTNYQSEDVVITTTAPALESKTTTNEFSLLEPLLKKYDIEKEDHDLIIGAIAFSKTNDKKSWDWILGDKLPKLTMANVGGYQSGTLSGIPADLQEGFSVASKISGIPNWLLAGISQQESSMNPSCDSSGGGFGIMQFQHYDFDGSDLFKYQLDTGMRQYLNTAGYSGSTDELWNKLVKDPKLQILCGAYEIRHYLNYILWKEKKASLDYASFNNMKLIKWDDPENIEVKTTIMRALASYNGGPSYMFDSATTYVYSVKVWDYAMGYRNSMTNVSGGDLQAKAINAGKACIGNSQYIFGRGRNESDQRNHIFDCSSFVWYCYHQAGKDLGPLASVTTYELVEKYVDRIDVNQMKEGDLIFFNTEGPNTHVGIYIGNGEFIDDETNYGVKITRLDNSYWSSHFSGVVGRIK